MPEPFRDPYSGLARGIESGTRLGLAIRGQAQEEEKLEFLQLQKQLEAKRAQDKADRDFQLERLEKAFDFHVKTKNAPGARKALVGMDDLGGTDLASRITDDRMAEFSQKMQQLDKADPAIQAELMEEILQEYPVISSLQGGEKGLQLTQARREAAYEEGPEAMAKERYIQEGVIPKGMGQIKAEVQSSKILPGGLTHIIRKDGTSELVKQDDADTDLIKQAEERGAALQGLRGAEREAGKKGIQQSVDAFKQLMPIKKNIRNLEKGIALLDKGAETGVIAKRLPTVRAASIELQNLQGQLGLDVIQNTTFGALSENELRFALDTSLPTGLDAPELRQWMIDKRDAQVKLADYLTDAAIFLGTPGNTIAQFLQRQQTQQGQQPAQPATADITTLSNEDLLRIVQGQ